VTAPARPPGAVAAILDDEWFDTAKAAAYSGRSTSHVRRCAASGDLESTSGGRGRGRRYRKSWVDEWIDRPARRNRRTGS